MNESDDNQVYPLGIFEEDNIINNRTIFPYFLITLYMDKNIKKYIHQINY